MKRALFVAFALVLGVPSFGQAGHISKIFPDNNGIALSTTSEVNGFTHLLLQANLNDLNLHAVFMGPTGSPDFVNAGLPWIFGQLVSIVPSGPNFVFTWNVFASGAGAAAFAPIGTLIITVTPP
jgi:hypothetical protein